MGIRTSLRIVENEDVVDAIATEAENHDLVILGANNEGLLTQMLFGNLTERIAAKCNNTVMLAKNDLGHTVLDIAMAWKKRIEARPIHRRGTA